MLLARDRNEKKGPIQLQNSASKVVNIKELMHHFKAVGVSTTIAIYLVVEKLDDILTISYELSRVKQVDSKSLKSKKKVVQNHIKSESSLLAKKKRKVYTYRTSCEDLAKLM